MSLLDKIKGADSLDTALTIKIEAKRKEELIDFTRDRKISMGKMARYGMDLIQKLIVIEDHRQLIGGVVKKEHLELFLLWLATECYLDSFTPHGVEECYDLFKEEIAL